MHAAGKSTSANSSPRITQKSTKLFGLLTKRPTKVEPQNSQTHNSNTIRSSPSPPPPPPTSSSSSLLLSTACFGNAQRSSQQHDLSFAKCTPERKAATTLSTIDNHQIIAAANNSTSSSASAAAAKAKSQTLPHFNQPPMCNNNLEKSQSSSAGLLSINYRKSKPSKSKVHLHRHSAEQTISRSQSGDGGGNCGRTDAAAAATGGDVVVRRKSPKKRSPNHNRFSHQFSLCCKAEKKPLTPPVTVRYNSIPDAANNLLRRDNLSLSWSLVDNASLSVDNFSEDASQNNSNMQQQNEACTTIAAATSAAAVVAAAAAAQTITKNAKLLECASAPQSPVTAKIAFVPLNAHNSPSNSSLKSTQSDAPPQSRLGKDSPVHAIRAPIRPISVTACRSRLRLKLYPPGKELPALDSVPSVSSETDETTTMRRHATTTPQHMSSPNIATQKDFVPQQSEQQGVRFMSHENIRMQRQASSSGLARNALMAAQVLSLIPTENARERSHLDGRLGSCSLLGPSELNRVLPDRQVTIFVGTWNMNGQSPPKQMNDFVLPATVEHVPDIVAIGTQESSPDRYEWEVTLQETLGPSHVLFHSTALGTLHLAILMRRDLIWYCSSPEDASLSVRTGSAFRTKGAVAISFCLFGTSMLFVTSHLTAHQQKVKERVSDVKRIIHALDLPKNLNLRHKSKDVTQNFDNVFWCGDLNFRLGEPREKLLEWIQNTKFPLPSHLPHGYMHTDQLSSVLSDGAAFRGFMEANITFPPTYKYDPGTQHFDTSSKQRAPAYTDRILYKYRQMQGLMTLRRPSMIPMPNALLTSMTINDASNVTSAQPYVECLVYDSVPSIITSDHKPVYALFKTLIRAGTDSIPLAAGLFNRDIYLEGLKRRLNNQYSGSSAVCSIQ